MSETKCPKCGSEYFSGEALMVTYKCGSSRVIGEPEFWQGLQCEKLELTTLRQQVKVLREALKWYADFAGTTAINYDLGKRASQAIETGEK